MLRCDVGNAYFACRITELELKTNRLVKSNFKVFLDSRPFPVWYLFLSDPTYSLSNSSAAHNIRTFPRSSTQQLSGGARLVPPTCRQGS